MSDYARDHLVDKLLSHVARNSDDERLRELAAGIQKGEAGWEESLGASFYAEALAPKLEGFAGWYQSLSDDERAEHAAKCEDQLNEIERQAAQPDTDSPWTS